MRVSTNIQFDAGLRAMTTQQSEIARLSQQISGERKVLNPGDDPIAAAREVTLTATKAAYEQMIKNQGDVNDSLKQIENTLDTAREAIGTFRTKLIALNSGALNDADRASHIKDMESLRDQLISVANQSDGNGNFLFSGYAAKTQPFVADGAGQIAYNGDIGVREVQIGPTRTMAANMTGDYLFMSVPTGNGKVEGTATSTNTGSGYMKNVSVTDNAAWKAAEAAGPYSVEFVSTTTGTTTNGIAVNQTVTDPAAWGKAAANKPFSLEFTDATTYTLTDGKGVTSTGTYTPGAPLTINGMQMNFGTDPAAGDKFAIGDVAGKYQVSNGAGAVVGTGTIDPAKGGSVTFAGITLDVSGVPNAGDTFTFKQPGTADIFASMQAAIDAAKIPAADAANGATQRNNVLREMMANIDGGLNRLLDATTTLGSRQDELDALTGQDTVSRDNVSAQITKEVGMGTQDLVAAISELAQRNLSLQAAQKVYAQVSNMSLFNII
ncbi:flagellar hook-associated protein 3 [Pigmentiphaga aceris]|uniref:Flagellar hook-associated protein 3 n=1 Tax=Pigmentiphaga aceris TaxID=1940612 RepID=A0A5C0AXK0_9BURK|nr:flagellar hook-associated protein FlgL [Pigmentiphaga aceris]QEI07212.1 flagellar hook-associated protein 3 [Pigmentiphaga aceris]